MTLFDNAGWEYNQPYLQFRNTSEQFWHRMEIDGKIVFGWFWLSDKHLARLDSFTGDYVFDSCKVCGPLGTRDENGVIWYPVYVVKPRMKQHEIQYFADKWDDWAKQIAADYSNAPEHTVYEEDGEGIISLGKNTILEITPIIWAKDILYFSSDLPKDYITTCPEPC